MESESSTPSTEAPQISNLTSESLSTSHNVAVITHSRFLVAVPSQFQCNPISRANKIAGRILESTLPAQVKSVAERPTATADILFLIFCVLVIIGFVGCCVVRALQQNYHVLLWFQVVFAIIVFFLSWAARKLWKPQHIVLSKETGMLHSCRNSFVPPVAIPISSIRFFRKTASFNPRFSRSRIKYGIEAVTTSSRFSFAFSTCEHVAAQLEELLNKYLQSLQDYSPTPSIFGNVGSAAASITASKNDIPDLQDLPGDSDFSFKEEERSITFKVRRKWVPRVMFITAGLFAIWIVCVSLSISSAESRLRDLFTSPSVIVGTVLYIVIFSILVLLQVKKTSWKFCNEKDGRNILRRFMSRKKIVKVSDYNSVRLERSEAKMLVFYVEKNRRGEEEFSGKRYSVVLKRSSQEGDTEMGILGKLTEGEVLFVIGKMGKAFPFLFPKDRCEV